MPPSTRRIAAWPCNWVVVERVTAVPPTEVTLFFGNLWTGAMLSLYIAEQCKIWQSLYRQHVWITYIEKILAEFQYVTVALKLHEKIPPEFFYVMAM